MPHRRAPLHTLTLTLALCASGCTAPVLSAEDDAGIGPGRDGGGIAVDAPIDPTVDAPATIEDGGTPVVPEHCETTALIEPTRAMAYYFSDCAAGAHAACVPGDDARPGTSADAPRRTPDGMDLDALAPGTQLLFARGGAWDAFHVQIENEGASATAPIVLGAYTPSWGGTERPWLRVAGGAIGVEIGRWHPEAAPVHGGYRIEGLHLDGGEVAQWGSWVRDGATHTTVVDCEIEGFEIGLYFGGDATPVSHLTVVDDFIHHNVAMGMLGHADDLVIEGNRIEANNFSGSGFNHGIYLGGHGARLRARNNVLARNSVVGGRCTGGNFTIHGHWHDALLEGNTIVQDVSDLGCYGFSITPAYNPEQGEERFSNFVVRGNTVVNLGACGVCAGSAPGIVVENNVFVSDTTTYAPGIHIPGIEPGPGDAADRDAVIRNNTFFYSRAAASPAISVTSGAGSGLTVVSNLIEFAAAGEGRCMAYGSASQFELVANNLCHGARWSDEHATLGAAQAAGMDLGGLSSDPMLAREPTAADGWDASLEAGSPAIDAGHAALSASSDRLCAPRSSAPDIGAYER